MHLKLMFALILLLPGGALTAVVSDSNGPATGRCKSFGLASCPEPFDPALPPAATMLSWDQPSRVIGFRNTYRLYQGDVFRTSGAKAAPLPVSLHALHAVQYHMDGHAYALPDYLRHQDVAGLLVLKDGKIVYEYYGGGNTDTTLWTSRSVAKSVVSILVRSTTRSSAISRN
jgi:hypothetical protein